MCAKWTNIWSRWVVGGIFFSARFPTRTTHTEAVWFICRLTGFCWALIAGAPSCIQSKRGAGLFCSWSDSMDFRLACKVESSFLATATSIAMEFVLLPAILVAAKSFDLPIHSSLVLHKLQMRVCVSLTHFQWIPVITLLHWIRFGKKFSYSDKASVIGECVHEKGSNSITSVSSIVGDDDGWAMTQSLSRLQTIKLPTVNSFLFCSRRFSLSFPLSVHIRSKVYFRDPILYSLDVPCAASCSLFVDHIPDSSALSRFESYHRDAYAEW